MNLINLLFIQFTIIIVLLGSLMNLVEDYLPVSIKQMFRYGKHSYCGDRADKFIKRIEIPKAYFRHFYIFAIIWSWLGLLLATSVYFYELVPPKVIVKYFDMSCGRDRLIETSWFQTLAALFLVSLQCTRRFIETNFLQIFSKHSKINLTHYMCGYLHYYGLVILILAKSDGFNSSQPFKQEISLEATQLLAACVSITFFIYMWYKQFETNMIFIKLRQEGSGKVNTERHMMPKGGWFNYVSSPHMTTEIGMYAALFILLNKNSSYIYCLTWVLSNQISNALLTHKWYMTTFKDYPKDRKAIIPFIL